MAAKIKEEFYKKEEQLPVRLNKLLGEAGVCSRREADRLLEAGKVTVDGKVASLGDKACRNQKICVNGKPVKREEDMILLAVNKPKGIVCTAEKREKYNIVDFIHYGKRIYPVGRLDKDSEGLILMTNNGEIVNKIMRAGNHHEKEYIVTVNKPVTSAFLKAMRDGVPILDTVTRKCKVESTGTYEFRIILTQGLNRQIRRMCEYLGYEVTKLQRIRIMNIRLNQLKSGTYRNVTEKEMEELYELIKHSSNETLYKEKTDEQRD